MADWPKVSVIVVNYNGLKHLDNCYKSLSELDYPAEMVELVCVDNASLDGSVEFLREKYPSVRIIINDSNLGFAEANNIGAEQVGSEFVAFLNNDTKVDKAWLKELVKAVNESPEIVCAGSKILDWSGKKIDFIRGNLNFYGHAGQPDYGKPDMPIGDNRQNILFACGGAMLIRRDVFLDNGGFDPDFFAFFEDVDLGWRLWVIGYEVVLAPRSVVYHRHHGTASKMANEKKMVLYERNALMSIFKNYEWENVEHILPAALLLVNRRAMTHLQLKDKNEYRLNPVEIAPVSPAASKIDDSPEGAIEKFKRIKKEEGGLFAMIPRVLYSAYSGARSRLAAGLLRKDPNIDVISRVGISGLIALDDFIEALPVLVEKRGKVQAARKRADREIFGLFGDPFTPSFTQPEIVRAQELLTEAFNITDVFKGGS